MCGRYTLGTELEGLLEALGGPLLRLEGYRPRYNIAPTQDAPVVIRGSDGLRLGPLRWGLVPRWADDPSIGNRMINARSETASSKPAFREAFRRRRCLVPADGFYEWRGKAGRKTPYWIHRPDGAPFTFAGLWEAWEPPEGEPLHTFTILTADASADLEPYHPRMPVVLPPSDRDRWLDPATGVEELDALLGPRPVGEFDVREVSTLVSSPAHDSPECILPATDEPDLPAEEDERDEPDGQEGPRKADGL